MALRRLSTSSLTNPKWYRDGSAGLGPYTDFELIDETVLTTSAASVTFSNLGDYSTIYKHLQIRITARSTRSVGAADSISLQFNSDTGNNYAFHRLIGEGAGVLSLATTSTSAARATHISQATTAANVFGGGVVDILDPFNTSKYKTIRSLGGVVGGTDVTQIGLISALWMNTNALTDITFKTSEAQSFATGSCFSLFGIKGA